MRKLYVRDGRSWFEILFLFASIFAAFNGLFTPTPPVMHAILGNYVSLWYGGLGLGGAIALAGVLRPLPLEVSSLVVERIGLLLLAGWLIAYSLTAVISGYSPANGVYLTTAIGIAAGMRAVEITWDISRIKRAERAERHGEEENRQ